MNNLELVKYCKEKLSMPTIYMLGGFGRKLTESMIQTRINKGCQHTIKNQNRIRQGIGSQCFDCVGLIKSYLWNDGSLYNVPKGSDMNVGMMYNSCTEKGALSTMPDIKGLLVFTADLGHIGIYIGKDSNGVKQYIESTPAWNKWGVCQSNDNIRTWDMWGKHYLIEYIEEVVEQTPEPGPIIYKFNIGDKVVLNGQLHGNSQGDNPGKNITGVVTAITRISEGNPYPYNTTGDLGWMKEDSLSKYIEPTEVPIQFVIGDIVIPIKLIDYNGKTLVQYDKSYTISEIKGDRVVLNARGTVWASMNIKDIKKV